MSLIISLRQKKILPILILVVVFGLSLYFLKVCFVDAEFSKSPDYLTVPEVRDEYKSLNGQKVRVRGWSLFDIKQTLLPFYCNCNRIKGELWLTNTRFEFDYEHRIEVSLPSCEGNMYSITCKSFDPSKANAFEIVGTIEVCDKGCKLIRITLINIDLAQSRQLINNIWTTIPIGDFIIPLGSSKTTP